MARGKQTALQAPGAKTTLLGSDDKTDELVDVYHEALTRRMAATKDEVAAKTALLARFEQIGVGPDRPAGGEYTTGEGRPVQHKLRVTIAKRKIKFVRGDGEGGDEEEAEGDTGEDVANAPH